MVRRTRPAAMTPPRSQANREDGRLVIGLLAIRRLLLNLQVPSLTNHRLKKKPGISPQFLLSSAALRLCGQRFRSFNTKTQQQNPQLPQRRRDTENDTTTVLVKTEQLRNPETANDTHSTRKRHAFLKPKGLKTGTRRLSVPHTKDDILQIRRTPAISVMGKGVGKGHPLPDRPGKGGTPSTLIQGTQSVECPTVHASQTRDGAWSCRFQARIEQGLPTAMYRDTEGISGSWTPKSPC